MKTHRDYIRQLIAGIIEKYRDDPGALKRALFDAYPYGERKYWPYKVWLSEIRLQLGLSKHLRNERLKIDAETTLMFPEDK